MSYGERAVEALRNSPLIRALKIPRPIPAEYHAPGCKCGRHDRPSGEELDAAGRNHPRPSGEELDREMRSHDARNA